MATLSLPLEDIYTIGLFRDCGIPLLALKYPDYKQVLIEANSNYQLSNTLIETKHYDMDHSRLAYLLAESWALPKPICQTILQNHERDIWSQAIDDHLLQNIAVLKIAENCVDQFRRHCENPDWEHHKEGALKALNLDEKLLLKLLDKVHTQLVFNNF